MVIDTIFLFTPFTFIWNWLSSSPSFFDREAFVELEEEAPDPLTTDPSSDGVGVTPQWF